MAEICFASTSMSGIHKLDLVLAVANTPGKSIGNMSNAPIGLSQIVLAGPVVVQRVYYRGVREELV